MLTCAHSCHLACTDVVRSTWHRRVPCSSSEACSFCRPPNQVSMTRREGMQHSTLSIQPCTSSTGLCAICLAHVRNVRTISSAYVRARTRPKCCMQPSVASAPRWPSFKAQLGNRTRLLQAVIADLRLPTGATRQRSAEEGRHALRQIGTNHAGQSTTRPS